MRGARAGSKVAQDAGFRHHKPRPFAPEDFEPYEGGADPARVSEAAHLSAQAFVQRGIANNDPEVSRRLIAVAEEEGLEVLAELWSEAPAHSLPGALWASRKCTRHGSRQEPTVPRLNASSPGWLNRRPPKK